MSAPDEYLDAGGPPRRDEIDEIIAEVEAERRRQIEVEGWTYEHDDDHTDGSLAMASSCYIDPDPELRWASQYEQVPIRWPGSWCDTWWKPKDRESDLIRGIALAIAELGRLRRRR